MSTYLLGVLSGSLSMVPLTLIAVAWLQRQIRERTGALREQIGAERIAALEEQQRMLKVVTDAGELDLAWRMLEAARPEPEPVA